MDDYQRPKVVRRYQIFAAGKGRISFQQLRNLVQQAGFKVVALSSGLTCGACLGRGSIVNPAHRGCIVMPADFLPCPAGCEEGRPTDEVRYAAIRAGEV